VPLPAIPHVVLPRPAGLAPVALSRLAAICGGVVSGADVLVGGVTASSAQVRRGDLFAGLPGRLAHGARFTAEAMAAGAVAVLTDAAGRSEVPPGVPVVLVDDARTALGPVAAEVYGRRATTFPSSASPARAARRPPRS
jgi:UDP-N-acetylmuramoyl-L-alanyl-D-glutamate--2,6-diaminopimelate ligase